MGILSDREIFNLCQGEKPLVVDAGDWKPNSSKITKTENGDVETKLMGFGYDSYGYDVRLARDVEIFSAINTNGEVFDPKRPTERGRIKGVVESNDFEEWVVLPPSHFLLGHCPEWINMPSDCIALVLGKSSYARNGIIVNPTVLKPGWEGQVVLEISNTTPVPVRIYINEGIAHFIFIQGNYPCELDYVARSGKYQGQKGVTPGRA